MKKIVFLIYVMSNGGVERHTVNLANEFVKNGYSVDIVATHGVSEMQFFDFGENIRLLSVDEKREKINYVETSTITKKENAETKTKTDDYQFMNNQRSKNQSFKQRLMRKVIPIWKKSATLHKLNCRRYKRIYCDYFLEVKPEIVVSFGVNYFERAFYSTKGLNCKLFDAEIVAHDIVLPENSPLSSYYCRMLKEARGIIVQTQSEKYFFNKINKNVSVINNPIKTNLPAPYKADRRKTIVNYCRMSSEKNLLLLIEAFDLFHKEYPEYNLEIFANTVEPADEKYKETVKEKISCLGLDDCVLIFPPAANVHDMVRDCAMFVSSSDYEGLSNSMLESMAIGLPCVCTDCLGGGTREVMVDHENGLIVPVNDPAAMYRAMKEFAENPELTEKCSQNAVKIREMLSVERISKQWMDFLRV